MNIGQTKLASWTVAGVLLLGMSFYVLDFLLKRYPAIRQPIDGTQVKTLLDSVKPVETKSEGGLVYKDAKRLFHELNWTGKVAPVQERVVDSGVAPPPQAVPVKDLVRILMVKLDTSDSKGSSLFFKYKQKANVPNTGSTGGFNAHEGDRLAPPHDKIRVEAIRAEGVVFAFDDTQRASETVSPEEYDPHTLIVQVGPDGVALPPTSGGIPRAVGAPFRPGKTTPMGPNRFRLGTDDAKYFAENYSDVFARQVQTAQHRDPNTGRYDGVEIKSVTPGSLAEQHGAQSGDVVKSINGHSVNSVQEAITFVKNNSDKYSTWEVVIENHGKTRTVTYESPGQ